MKKITIVLLAILITLLIIPQGYVAGYNEIWASSGTASDIQAAVNTATGLGGGRVHVPSGNYTFGGSVAVGSNIIIVGAGVNSTILHVADVSQKFSLSGDNIRITGISLRYTGAPDLGQMGVSIDNCVDFRIDHSEINGFDYCGIEVAGLTSRGVIDNCFISTQYPVTDLGYGVVVERDNYYGDLDLGTNLATFIEDCTFVNCRHSVAANAGAHYVFRYNHCYNGVIGQQVDAHGIGYGSTVGTRCVEVYENLIEDPISGGTGEAIFIRGGDGVVYDNTIYGYKYAVVLTVEGFEVGDPYPIPCQIRELYLWNNPHDGAGGNVVVSYAVRDYNYLIEDRDYFLYERSGYTPYYYPHPLREEVVNRVNGSGTGCGF